ncbi:MAG: transglutaminase-like domain-containing protein [Desulfobacula sp.]|nr:transglutaminase-like domain-containing protein [Desulfobacula sp.]
MRPSLFFIPGALIFWGWQMQTLWIAVVLVLIILFSEWSRTKFDLSVSDFNKFVDVSTIILAGTIVLALTIDAKKAIWMLLKWLPVVLFPIVAAQKFTSAGKIDIQSFFLTARRSAKRPFTKSGKKTGKKTTGEPTKGQIGTLGFESKKIDISYLYVLFCILSSGANLSRDYLFFTATVFFTIWALWHVRSKRVSVWIWSGFVVLAIGSGYAGHKAVLMTSIKINQWVIAHYTGMYSNNPFKTHTALGEIGKLKLSNKIVLRAAYENYKQGNTYLLHNGSYNKFLKSTWFARSDFEPIVPADNKTYWQINPKINPSLNMTLYFKPDRKKSVLSLPAGTMTISNLKADKCRKNQMQVVRVEDTSPIISADVSYTEQHVWDIQPYDRDLLIPREEVVTVTTIVGGLQLTGKTPQEILVLVKAYFSNQYTYSLELQGKGKYETPLENFLLHAGKGHCELFATATALILRATGIPARYATGFIVHEYSDLENRLVVRQRDAHAWVKAFIDGKWQDVDTTPSGFFDEDNKKNPSSFFSDLFSYLAFVLSQVRHETGKEFINKYGLWLILPLAIILVLRLRKASRIKRVKPSSDPMTAMKDQQTNDSFYLLETYLKKKGMPRYAYETFSSWLERIEPYWLEHNMSDELKILLRTHNRMRFAKAGVTNQEKETLYAAIEAIIRINQIK